MLLPINHVLYFSIFIMYNICMEKRYTHTIQKYRLHFSCYIVIWLYVICTPHHLILYMFEYLHNVLYLTVVYRFTVCPFVCLSVRHKRVSSNAKRCTGRAATRSAASAIIFLTVIYGLTVRLSRFYVTILCHIFMSYFYVTVLVK